MDINNNTVLITGGSSGIGLSLAKHFLDANNKVVIVGRNQQKLNQAKSQLPALITYQCDISDISQLESLVRNIENQHRDLTILVNNAGIQYNYRFLENSATIENISSEIEINLSAPIKLISLLLPILLNKEQAAIVNVSSALGLVPKESAPVYCGTKAGLHIYTKVLRYQLENTVVKVFEVIPPLVDTDMTRGRGKNKMAPKDVARKVIMGMEKDHFEINIGKVKLLRFVNRLSPGLADRIMNKA